LPWIKREDSTADRVKREIFNEISGNGHSRDTESRKYKMLENKYRDIGDKEILNHRRKQRKPAEHTWAVKSYVTVAVPVFCIKYSH